MKSKKDLNETNLNEETRSKPLIFDDHPRPTTRRDFLSQGFMAFSAMSFIPASFGFNMLSARADGEECGGGGESGAIPFMVFDMAGGAALPGNFLVGKQGGPEDLLRSYDRIGFNPREGGGLNRDFGLPMAANASTMLQGILDNTSPEARALFRMGSICHFAQDDTGGNPLSAVTLVQQAGANGLYMSNGLGIRNRRSGGNSDVALAETSLKPTFISGIGDIQGAVNFGGDSFSDIRPESLRPMATGALELSRGHWEQLLEKPSGGTLMRLARCAYRKSLNLLDGVTGVDPRNDQVVQNVYGINANSSSTDSNAVAAGIAMNAIRGYSGPGVWTLGGCDYHDGTFTTGDGKDREMGVQIGRAVETAHRLQRPLFFQLLTDGGCDSVQGGREWRGDSGDKCMTVMGFYHPNNAPEMRRLQVGHYTDGQGAARDTLLGATPRRVAYAVFANYLNISGRLGELENYLPGEFTTAELDSLLVFDPVA